ncbi:MAG: hypothetical protein ACJ74Z_20320 [Bryobacteraceae bacterium]
MKAKILTIFPLPVERYVAVQSARKEGLSCGRPEALEPATGSINVLPSIESLILRKLLAEVEARQITRVQPTYVIEQRPPARYVTPIRTLCCLLWAASIALTALTVKYVDSQTVTNDNQSRSLETLTTTIVHQNEAFGMIIGSFQQLAGTVASSAKRTEAMPEMLARLANHLQQMRPPAVKEPPELAVQPQMPQMLGTSPGKDDSAPIYMGGHIHPPIEWALVPSNVVAHNNSAGTVDYWLVPRIQSGVSTMVKVVPIVQNNSGTFVHHIAEVKDYTVTPSGDWVESSEPAGKKE